MYDLSAAFNNTAVSKKKKKKKNVTLTRKMLAQLRI